MPHEVALQTLDVSLTMNLGDVSSQCILVINELAPSRVMHFAMQGKKCNRIHRLKDDDDIDQNMFFLKKKYLSTFSLKMAKKNPDLEVIELRQMNSILLKELRESKTNLEKLQEKYDTKIKIQLESNSSIV